MNSHIVDLWFPILGRTLPSDHGYPLYGALSGECPELHGSPWWGLHTVPGTLRGDGSIVLSSRPSLGLRLAAERIGTVLKLAGRKLDVDGHSIRLAPPSVQPLQPSTAVSARIVTIKGFMEPKPFENAVERQLQESGIDALIEVGPRKVVQVRENTVVGFSVRLTDITARESLEIQCEGIGGRRRFGCGVFNPSGNPLTDQRRTGEAGEAAR